MSEFNSSKPPVDIDVAPPLDELRQEGDFILDEIILTTTSGSEHDLKFIREDINIYSNIFGNIVSGTITLMDANDLPNLMPLIGEEKIRLKFTRPDVASGDFTATSNFGNVTNTVDEINAEFRIYKMSDRRLFNEKTQTYTLHFVSEEYIKNFKCKISLPFKNMKCSEMVENVYNEFLKVSKDIEVEDTRYEHDFIAGMITPLQMINMISTRAIATDSSDSYCLFYEDTEKFNFKSIANLIQQPPVQTFIFQVANVLNNSGKGNASIPRFIDEDLRAVMDFTHTGSFDILKDMVEGKLSSRLITYDIVRRKIDQVDFNYLDEFNNTPKLDSVPVHTENLDALGDPQTMIKLMSTNKDHDKLEHIIDKQPGIKPSHIEESQLLRYSRMQQINDKKITILVSGDPRIKVGNTVEFQLPQFTGDADQRPEEDKYLSGKYLIVALRHRILQSKYLLEMEIVKDSFISDVEHVDPREIYDRTW